MKSESILLVRRNSLSFGHLRTVPTLLLMIITGVFLSSCSYLQNSTGSNLERQIELQHIQQDLLSEPIAEENRTAAEFEEIGDRYILQGDINRAYLYYVKGLGVEPDKASLLHKQGTLLLKKNKYAQAEPVYRRLLSLDGKDALAHEGLGKTCFGQGKYLEAEQAFLAALAIRPDLWQAHEFLGLIESQRQDYPQAINHFKTALTKKPGRLSISNNLAVTYYLNGNFDDAARVLRELPATTNRKVYNNLALAYFQQGYYQNALASFKKGTGNEAVAYNNMGYEYLSVKKYSEAIEALQKAIDLHPKFYPSAQKNLNQAQRELSNPLTEAGS
jgi:Flp pilus assembly protein TadD